MSEPNTDGAAALPQPPTHMTPEVFRDLGRRVVDWVADYMASLEARAPAPDVAPGQVARSLPESPPHAPESWDEILADLDRVVVPGLLHWQSPRFFGYFPANATGPAILGDLVSAGLGVQGMLWATSPACTELEMRVLDWLAQIIALPELFHSTSGAGGGVIQGTASEATLVALLAARARARIEGSLVAYTSTQAHSSVAKAAMIAGLGREALRLIDVDEELALRPEALRERMRADRSSGRAPFFVCATVGTTSSGAIDPVAPIGRVCEEFGAWLHVDAAWAGAMAVCPEHRKIIEGVGLAHSFCFNPHKWLLTNFDLSALWTRDRAAVLDALSITPEYLRNRASESGAVIDYRDWQVPLGRRFRALKLWFVIRAYGVEGLRAHIRHSIALARRFEALVRADRRFELAAPRSGALVCFRLAGVADEANRALLESVVASEAAYLTHTTLPDPHTGGERYTLRMAIGGVWTRATHVETAWSQIQRCADELIGAAPA